jgi:hypothetical protein
MLALVKRKNWMISVKNMEYRLMKLHYKIPPNKSPYNITIQEHHTI